MRKVLLYGGVVWVLAVSSLSWSGVPKVGKAIGIEPIDAALMEDHSDAFIAWRQAGFKKRIVVHIDSHIDLQWVSPPDLKRIVEAKTVEELRGIELDTIQEKERFSKPLSITNFLYPAIMEGIVKELYWVTPDSLMAGRKVLDDMKSQLIDTLDRLSIDDLDSFQLRNGVVKGRVYGIPLTICKLSDLPLFNEAVLLDIDVDYFDPPDLRKRLALPSIWPNEFITALMKKGMKSDSVTISYSVRGGYLALEYKFLGDDLANILKDPKGSQSVLAKMRIHRRSGHVYRSKGMYSEAVHEFQKGLELSPDDAALHYGLGLAYSQWGKADEASIEFDRAKALDGRYENSLLSDADYYFRKGLCDRALPLYEQVLQKKPVNPGALVAAGICSSKQEAFEKAVHYYQTLIDQEPAFYLPHFNLGAIYSRLEQWEAAEREYQQAVGLEPSLGKAYQNLGLLYMKQGDMDRAMKAFEKTVENNPCFKGAQNNLGILYANAGRYDEASSAFTRAIRIDSTYVAAYRNLGKTYLIQGKVSNASEAFEQALTIDPKDESVLRLRDSILKK
jgi:tetratricopeptide (TPR) repeat protein